MSPLRPDISLTMGQAASLCKRKMAAFFGGCRAAPGGTGAAIRDSREVLRRDPEPPGPTVNLGADEQPLQPPQDQDPADGTPAQPSRTGADRRAPAHAPLRGPLSSTVRDAARWNSAAQDP